MVNGDQFVYCLDTGTFISKHFLNKIRFRDSGLKTVNTFLRKVKSFVTLLTVLSWSFH